MEDLVLPKKVLLVDDDSAVGETLEAGLKKHGIALVRVTDLDTALYQFNQQLFDVAIVELEFGPLPGLALVQKFRTHEKKERRETGIIIASGQQRGIGDEGLAAELGDIEFVTKPLVALKLLPVLGRALQRRRAMAELEEVKTICYDMLKRKPGDVAPVIEFLKPRLPKLPARRAASLMAGLFEEAGNFDEALAQVDAQLAKNPDDVVALNTRGRLLLRMKRPEEAKAALEKADKVAPKNIDRVRSMATMYLDLKDPKASLDKMREVVALSPEQQELKFDLFKQLESFGFEGHAVDFCRETTPPTEVMRYYNNKGVSLSQTGNADEALAEYERALKFYPDFKQNYRILFNVALAEAHRKTPESAARAIESLTRCLELKPDFDKARSLLELLQRATGARKAS